MRASSFPASFLPRPLLDAWLSAMCDFTGLNGHVELLLVSDAAIAALNKNFLDCQGPTNILSFPAEDLAPSLPENVLQTAIPLAHSLVLSVDTLRRECLLYGQNYQEHALRLLAHGFAHLTGLDHGPEMDILCEHLVNAIRDQKEKL